MIIEDEDGGEVVFRNGRTEVRKPDGTVYVERADGQTVWFDRPDRPILVGRDRLRLIRDTYLRVYAATEVFSEDDIGTELAYLLGAIATRGMVELAADSALLAILRREFPGGHAIWQFIDAQG